MIRLLEERERRAFLTLCDRDYVFGAEIRTRLAVFGLGSRQADFWLASTADGTPCAAICRDNGRVMVSATAQADPEEMNDFLCMVGGYRVLYAEAPFCSRLLPERPMQSAPAMYYTGACNAGDAADIVDALPLADLYGLLARAFSDWDSEWEQWYVYASHLFRHGLGFASGIYRGGELAATGGVYAMGAHHGVIACVATGSEHRRRGLAERLVMALCCRLLHAGKTPVLLCAEERLADYYARMGFHVFARWGRKTLE